MLKLNINLAKNLYQKYGEQKLSQIIKKYGKCKQDIQLKIPHGLTMANEVKNLTEETHFFNESYYIPAALDGLLHDIGRFEQYLITESLLDFKLEAETGIIDHGILGKYILLKKDQDKIPLIEKFIPDTRLYDKVLTEIIYNHTNIHNFRYHYELYQLNGEFKNYSIEEIIKNEKLLNKLISIKIRLVQEADNFELLHNIVNKHFIPAIRIDEKHLAKKEAWDLFFNNEYINIGQLKKLNAWSCNSGALLRFGLLPQKAQLTATLKLFIQNGYIDKLYQLILETAAYDDGRKGKLNDPMIEDGYHYTKLLINNIIKGSDVFITPEERRNAVELSKKEWQKRL